MRNLCIRYIKPKYIISLDDIDFGEIKRGIYVCTSTTHPTDLKEGDLLYEKDTQRLFHVVDESGTLVVKPLVTINWVREVVTIDSTLLSAGQYQLSIYPNPTSVMLSICGISQRYGEDYSVVDDKLVWHGYVLENQLEVGDELDILYIPIIG